MVLRGLRERPARFRSGIKHQTYCDHVARQRGSGALDLRGLGTRRFQLSRPGAPADRIRDRRWPCTRHLDGAGGAAEGFRDYLEAWEEYGIDAEEYRELDDERVLALFRRSGRGKLSGVGLGQIQSNAAMLFHIRDCKVTRIVVYYDRHRALADLGLSSDGDAS